MKASLRKTKVSRRPVDGHGGARLGAGRPPKLDTEKFGRVTCVLRLDTIEQLRAGARSRHFGEFLQWHLDRHPLPSFEVYQALSNNRPVWEVSGKRRTQVLHAVTSSPRTAKRHRWAKKDLPKLTPSLLKKLQADGKNTD